MDRQWEHKKTKLPFTSEGARLKRAQKFEEKRREQRNRNISKFRDIHVEDDTIEKEDFKDETVNERMAKLMKWKAERALQKKLEAKNKKPVFKIGVPHHNFYSPKMKDSQQGHCHRKPKVFTPAPSGTKISRATERRLAAKAAEISGSQAGKTPIARSTRSRKKAAVATDSKLSKIKIDNVESFVSENSTLKMPPVSLFGQTAFLLKLDAPKKMNEEKTIISSQKNQLFNNEFCKKSLTKPCSTSKSEVVDTTDLSIESGALKASSEYSPANNNKAKVESTEKTEKLEKKGIRTLQKLSSPDAAQYLPSVCTSRGKRSARKEIKKRMSLRMSRSPMEAEIPIKETVIQSLNISVEEEENTAGYYRSLAHREENRLRELCQEWEKIQTESDMVEEGVYHINSATGQANLLIRKKFERFLQLVADCETGKGERLVRCRDLQGFWELVARETADCDLRFSKLHILRANNWIEKAEEIKPVIKKRALVNKKKKISASSNMRDFIDAQRKKKFGLSENVKVENDENEEKNQVKSVKFSANSSKSISSPRPNSQLTPRINSSKQIKLSESAKKLALVSIQIAQSCKTPEVLLDRSISYINSDQTPKKGIFKKQSGFPTSGSRLIRSAFKVKFNDTVSTKEATINENNSAVVQQKTSKIDLVSDEKEDAKINKKLNFEDERFLEEPLLPGKKRSIVKKATKRKKGTDYSTRVLPEIEAISATEVRISPIFFITEEIPPGKMKKKKSGSSRSASILESNDLSISASEMSKCTPREETRSIRNKSNSDDTVDKENNFSGIGKKMTKSSFSQRKSTRKSTKAVDQDDCAACSVVMPGTPRTPRRKKEMSISRDPIQKTLINSDLLSFDSTARLSTRLRCKNLK